MTYRTEFPDYPADMMPAIPEGFVDQSWHNDLCPSFEHPVLGIQLWTDYLDPEADTPRFCLYWTVGGEDNIGDRLSDNPALETNEWAEVEAFVADAPARRTAFLEREGL